VMHPGYRHTTLEYRHDVTTAPVDTVCGQPP
jgi:hypothetical protein